MGKKLSAGFQRICLAALILVAFALIIRGFVPAFTNSKTAEIFESEIVLDKDDDRLKFVIDGTDANQKEENSLVFKFENRKFKIDLRKFRIEKIYYYKDYSGLNIDEYSRATLKNLCSQGFTDKEALNYVYPGMLKEVERHLSIIDEDAVDARVKFYPDRKNKFEITPHKTGRKVKREELYQSVINTIIGRRIQPIPLSTDKIDVNLTTADARRQTQLVSSFSTSYATSSDDRKHNVRLALGRFNGRVVEPGQKISFNETAGERSEKNGYKIAKIIKQGKFEDGVGGGVCQSSTTLYNAAVLADMDIITVSNHSLPVSYVDASFDAMVNGSWSDLVFCNPNKTPVYIRTYSTNERVYVEFYGVPHGYRIVRKSITDEIIPHKDAEIIVDNDGKYSEFVTYTDERAFVSPQKDGLKSRGILLYYNANGKLVKQKEVRKDTYAAQNGVIAVGTKKRPPPPPLPPPPPPEPEENNGEGLIDTIIRWLS